MTDDPKIVQLATKRKPVKLDGTVEKIFAVFSDCGTAGRHAAEEARARGKKPAMEILKENAERIHRARYFDEDGNLRLPPKKPIRKRNMGGRKGMLSSEEYARFVGEIDRAMDAKSIGHNQEKFAERMQRFCVHQFGQRFEDLELRTIKRWIDRSVPSEQWKTK